MSRHAAIEQAFGDGEYTFRLGLSEIEELERKRECSIYLVVDRLRTRTCWLQDIMETLRLGLIGGGMKPVDALHLVRRYVDERPMEENRDVAYAVGLAALLRVHSNELEQPPGEAEAAEPSDSTSPQSTEPPQ